MNVLLAKCNFLFRETKKNAMAVQLHRCEKCGISFGMGLPCLAGSVGAAIESSGGSSRLTKTRGDIVGDGDTAAAGNRRPIGKARTNSLEFVFSDTPDGNTTCRRAKPPTRTATRLI